jgi:hypothetical protein
VCHPDLARQVLTDFRGFDRAGPVYDRVRLDRFDAGRWLAPAAHRAAFLPFGAGATKCIGEEFGLAEATLVLASIIARWNLPPRARRAGVPGRPGGPGSPGIPGPPVTPCAGFPLRVDCAGPDLRECRALPPVRHR